MTERLKIVPVESALTKLSTDGGVSLGVTTSLADLKITVFAKEVPIHRLMMGIAETLHATWKNEGSVFRLAPIEGESARTLNYLDREDRELRRQAEVALKGQNVSASVGESETITDSDTGQTRVLPPGIVAMPLSDLLSNWSPTQTQAFWAGEPQAVAFPAPTPRGRSREARGRLGGAAGATILVRYDPFGSGAVEVSDRRNTPLPRAKYLRPPESLASDPFAKEVLAWPSLTGAGDTFHKPLGPAGERSAWPDGRRSLADVLQELHDRSGLPIVADAFRVPIIGKDSPRGSDGLSWLSSLATSQGAFVRITEGVVMVRHGAFWRLRKEEIPEKGYARLEGLKATPTLDDYARFAGGLTPMQAATFATDRPPLTRFDVTVLTKGTPALRFYAALSADQRQAAQGRGLALTAMRNAQTSFLEAWRMGPFAGAQSRGNAFGASPSQLGSIVTLGEDATTMLFGTSPRDGVLYTLPAPKK